MLPKAKELKRIADKVAITLAKKGTLHSRRLPRSRVVQKEVVTKLIEVLVPRYSEIEMVGISEF